MQRMLGMRGPAPIDAQGLPPEVAALIAHLQQQVQDQAQQLYECDQALAQRDALLQRKDSEIALRRQPDRPDQGDPCRGADALDQTPSRGAADARLRRAAERLGSGLTGHLRAQRLVEQGGRDERGPGRQRTQEPARALSSAWRVRPRRADHRNLRLRMSCACPRRSRSTCRRRWWRPGCSRRRRSGRACRCPCCSGEQRSPRARCAWTARGHSAGPTC